MGRRWPGMPKSRSCGVRTAPSWLMASRPSLDVARALDIDGWPDAGTYDTLAGFLMVMLRRIPAVPMR